MARNSLIQTHIFPFEKSDVHFLLKMKNSVYKYSKWSSILLLQKTHVPVSWRHIKYRKILVKIHIEGVHLVLSIKLDIVHGLVIKLFNSCSSQRRCFFPHDFVAPFLGFAVTVEKLHYPWPIHPGKSKLHGPPSLSAVCGAEIFCSTLLFLAEQIGILRHFLSLVRWPIG